MMPPSSLTSNQSNAEKSRGLNNHNLFSFKKSQSYQVNERQRTHIQRLMKGIPRDLAERKTRQHLSHRSSFKKHNEENRLC